MSDGFDPHRELATIYSFKESVLAMRQCSRIADEQIAEALSLPLHDPRIPISDRIKIWEVVKNRAYGKPHTLVHVTTDAITKQQSRVILQENGRNDVAVQTIENEQ